MNRSLTYWFFFLLCWLLISANCKKNTSDDGLPPLTFIGANTIGCKIDGVVWVPKGTTGGPGVINYPLSGGYHVTALFPGLHILIKTNSPDGQIELFCRNLRRCWCSIKLENDNSSIDTNNRPESFLHGILSINDWGFLTPIRDSLNLVVGV